MRGALLEEAFGMHEWVQELYGFNVHYVEQLGAIMLTFEGRMALSRLEHALSESYINQLQSRVDKFMVQYHKLSLSAPRNVSPVSGMSILPQRSYGLGYKLPPHLQVLRFGGILPPHVALSMVPPRPPSAAPLPP